MDGNNGPDRKNLVGGALLLAALAVAAAGALISLRTGSSDVFMWMSIPAAILIVSGGAVISGKALPGADRLLLPKGECTVTAEVLGVTRNLRTKGEKTEYYIVCRCRDPRTGKEETFSSRPLDTYPGREVIGKKGEVHLDAGEKGKYTVDIDPLLKEIEAEREKKSDEKAD